MTPVAQTPMTEAEKAIALTASIAAREVDPRSFDDPETVRFDRKLSATRHSAMGNGPHRCVGATLARMEIIVFLREWLARMPDYWTHPGRPVVMKGDNVGACTDLPLQWTH